MANNPLDKAKKGFITFQEERPIVREVQKGTPQKQGTPGQQVKKPESSISPEVMEKSEEFILGTPQYKTNLGFQRELEAKKEIRSKYLMTGKIPNELYRQINPPSEIQKVGASEEYRRYNINLMLGLKTKEEKQTIENKMRSSHWYMSTQPIYTEEGSQGKKTFEQLKAVEPALYLGKTSEGFYEPTLDTERWYRNYFSEVKHDYGLGGVAVISIPPAMRDIFDVNYWFAEDRAKYSHQQFYMSKRAEVRGENVGLSVISYGMPIIETGVTFGAGYAFGKLRTSVKLAGGIGKASKAVSIPYVTMAGAGLAMGGKSVIDTSYNFYQGNVREGAKGLTHLGAGLVIGGLGYRAGAKAGLASYSQKNPFVEWAREGIIVPGEKYYTFNKEQLTMIRTGGKLPITLKEYGYAKYMQRYKPSRNMNQYIRFPGSESMLRPKFDANILISDNVKIGTVSGTTKTFKTRTGRPYAYSYDSTFGMQKSLAYDVFKETGFDINNRFGDYLEMSMSKGTIKMPSDRFIIKTKWGTLTKDTTATQILMPQLMKEPRMSFPSMKNQTFIPKFNIGELGFYAPVAVSLQKINKKIRFRSEIDTKTFRFAGMMGMVSGLNVGFKTPSISRQTIIPSMDFKLSQRQIQLTNYKSDIKQSTKLIDIQMSQQEYDYKYKMPSIYFPTYPLRLSGGGRSYNFDKFMKPYYKYREFKIPELWEVF